MSFKTNPIANRLKISKGWKNSLFPQKKRSYVEYSSKLFKMYKHLQTNLQIYGIHLLDCNIITIKNSEKIIFLKFHKTFIKRIKKKKTRRELKYIVDIKLNRIKFQNAINFFYKDTKVLKNLIPIKFSLLKHRLIQKKFKINKINHKQKEKIFYFVNIKRNKKKIYIKDNNIIFFKNKKNELKYKLNLYEKQFEYLYLLKLKIIKNIELFNKNQITINSYNILNHHFNYFLKKIIKNLYYLYEQLYFFKKTINKHNKNKKYINSILIKIKKKQQLEILTQYLKQNKQILFYYKNKKLSFLHDIKNVISLFFIKQEKNKKIYIYNQTIPKNNINIKNILLIKLLLPNVKNNNNFIKLIYTLKKTKIYTYTVKPKFNQFKKNSNLNNKLKKYILKKKLQKIKYISKKYSKKQQKQYINIKNLTNIFKYFQKGKRNNIILKKNNLEYISIHTKYALEKYIKEFFQKFYNYTYTIKLLNPAEKFKNDNLYDTKKYNNIIKYTWPLSNFEKITSGKINNLKKRNNKLKQLFFGSLGKKTKNLIYIKNKISFLKTKLKDLNLNLKFKFKEEKTLTKKIKKYIYIKYLLTKTNENITKYYLFYFLNEFYKNSLTMLPKRTNNILKKNTQKLKLAEIKKETIKLTLLSQASNKNVLSRLMPAITLFSKYLNPKLLADLIALEFEKTKYHKPLIHVIRCIINLIRFKRGIGYRIGIFGKINGSNRTQHMLFGKGPIPNQTFTKNIDFAHSQAKARTGTFTIKIWVYS